MSEEPTPWELGYLAIRAAEANHTPRLDELPYQTCQDILKDQYGECDGKLEVLDVSPSYRDYSYVFVQCINCRAVTAIPNPRRRASQAKLPSTPDWKNAVTTAPKPKCKEAKVKNPVMIPDTFDDIPF